MHPAVKRLLGYKAKSPDAEVLADWRRRTRSVCKPCWELRYCPYGPLVEDFPLPPPTRQHSVEHNRYLRSCLESGTLGNGKKLDKGRRKFFEEEVRTFDARRYPESLPQVVRDASCRIFGHLCPVFFMAEPFTETKDYRTHTRTIPREVMLKVVRRDGQICQECNELVPDNQVEFDHIIPFAKGGTSTSDNLRLLHRACNRQRRDSLAAILSPNPVLDFVKPTQRMKKS